MKVQQKGLPPVKQDMRMTPTALQSQPQRLHKPQEATTPLLLVLESQDLRTLGNCITLHKRSMPRKRRLV